MNLITKLVDQIHDICVKTEKEFKVGYVTTPEYPFNLGADLRCPCFLQADTNIFIEVNSSKNLLIEYSLILFC